MLSVYWHARMLVSSARMAMVGYHLGDEVIYRGKRWILYQGVGAPRWHMSLVGGDETAKDVHEDEFRRVRSFGNYWHAFRSRYRWYVWSWLKIYVESGCWTKREMGWRFQDEKQKKEIAELKAQIRHLRCVVAAYERLKDCESCQHDWETHDGVRHCLICGETHTA